MLTKRQLELYKKIEAYKKKHEVIPSYDEMAGMMDLASKSGIERMIESMEKRGAVKRMPGLARSLKLMPLE